MDTLLIIVHVLVCLFLVGVVLLQHGKGADIGASFGGSSQTLFGTEGPLPLLNKITTGAAIIFMLTSLTLAYISSQTGNTSVMGAAAVSKPAATQAAPAAPAEEKSEAAPAAEAAKPAAEQPAAESTTKQ
jgi:preprotein translocase subunit SecG